MFHVGQEFPKIAKGSNAKTRVPATIARCFRVCVGFWLSDEEQRNSIAEQLHAEWIQTANTRSEGMRLIKRA
jgi:hypothetical protein